jgi:hypothetical protein
MSTSLAEKSEYKVVSLDRAWYWMDSYPNYAPSGLPDFDQNQDQWKGIIDGGNGVAESVASGDDVQVTAEGGLVDPDAPAVIAPGLDCALESTPGGDDITVWMFSNAVSTINCLWWLDSRYADSSGFPGDGEDIYPLISDYGAGDDHTAANAPLSIERMANMLDITSTIYLDDNVWVDGIDEWFVNVSLEDKLDVNFYNYPTFEFIAGEIEIGKAVILVIGFIDDSSGDCVIVESHSVTCAGVNTADTKIAISDPIKNKNNPSNDDHNDTQYVSHDIYKIQIGSPCSNLPEIECWLAAYESGYNYSVVHSALVVEYINNPPDTPTIDGPTEGNAGTTYTYTFNSIDPDGDDIHYYVIWDDGYIENWEGPFESGEDFEIDHTYTKEGTYTIEAKAKDHLGVESGVATLEVAIPRYKATYDFIIHRFFERFPNAFPILRYLLGLYQT